MTPDGFSEAREAAMLERFEWELREVAGATARIRGLPMVVVPPSRRRNQSY